MRRDDDDDEHGERRGRGQRLFPAGGVEYIDYKDIDLLSKALTPQGKLLSRKRTGADAKTQHKLRRAVLRARFMALIPFGS